MAGCPSCSAPTDPLDRFCGRCGTALAGTTAVASDVARYCTGCGRALQADARFCRRCGARTPEVRRSVERPSGHDLRGNGGNGGRIARAPVPPAGRPTEAITEQVTVGPRLGSRQPAPGPPTATATLERAPVSLPEEERPPAPAPTPPAHEVGRARSAGFPWGGTLALLGSLAVILSAILDWGGAFRFTLPRDISATWLLEPSGVVSGPSLGIVMLLAGTLGALVSLIGMAAPSLTFLRRIVGLLTLMVPMAFAFRTLQLAEDSGIAELPSMLGVGVGVAALGALVQLAAGRPRSARI